jgi:hypothetical protein
VIARSRGIIERIEEDVSFLAFDKGDRRKTEERQLIKKRWEKRSISEI